MPRPKKYATNAERQRAYRKRKKQAAIPAYAEAEMVKVVALAPEKQFEAAEKKPLKASSADPHFRPDFKGVKK